MKRFKQQSGLTIVEAVVSLVIVATAIIPALAALGSASENVMVSTNRRVMRYLAEIVISDIELGQIKASDDGEQDSERYEEGFVQSFEGIGSADNPNEYADYEFTVEVHREIDITGGALEDEGGSPSDGEYIGRPVSNDTLDPGDRDQEDEENQGQQKRIVVIAIRRIGDDWSDDRTLRVMTILPVPGEEDQELGAGAAGGPGGVPGASGGPGSQRGGNTTNRQSITVGASAASDAGRGR